MSLRPRHPLLLLVALLAAYLLWYSESGKRREETAVRSVRAPLTLVNLPPALVITSSVPDTVALQLRGPLSQSLDSRTPLEVLLDLSGARTGTQTLTISEADLQLPAEVRLVSIDPAEITLEIERLESAILPVRAVLEGTPAPGFTIGAVRVVPPQLKVQGPASLLQALTSVETTAVSVEGAADVVEATAQPRLPHPLLRSLTAVPLLVVVEVGVPDPDAAARPRRH